MEVYKLLSSLLDLKRFCVSKITYFLSFMATNESKNEKYAKIWLYTTVFHSTNPTNTSLYHWFISKKIFNPNKPITGYSLNFEIVHLQN